MTQLKLKGPFLVAMLSLCSLAAKAYDMEDYNASGYYTYYNKLYDDDGSYHYNSDGKRTCELTYKNTSYNSYSGTIKVVKKHLSSTNNYFCIGIGEKVCYNCTSLTTVNFAAASNVTFISDSTFCI